MLNKGREGWKYERGAGVRGRDDRVGGGRFGTERERYNGRNGGRVFKWYTRPVFNNYLAQMGVSEESCTERQCMLALGATSDELRKYGMVTRRLTPFLGPCAGCSPARRCGRRTVWTIPQWHSGTYEECKQ